MALSVCVPAACPASWASTGARGEPPGCVAGAVGVALQQPAAVLAQGAVGTQPEHRKGDPDQACGEVAGFLSAAAALLSPGALERDFSSSSTFFPRGFHEDSCICPCSSLQPPAVNSTCCKTCCSQVSLSHVQQWPGRSGAGGRAEPGFASCSPSRRLWFFHCCSS